MFCLGVLLIVLKREHVQRKLQHACCIQLQPPAHIPENAVHDVVAADTACGNFLLAVILFILPWLQSRRIRILGLYPVLIKNLPRVLGIPVELIQQHVAEADGRVSRRTFTPILLVGEVAGQGGSLAVDCYPPALEVRVRVRESCYVTQIHSSVILLVSVLLCNLY